MTDPARVVRVGLIATWPIVIGLAMAHWLSVSETSPRPGPSGAGSSMATQKPGAGTVLEATPEVGRDPFRVTGRPSRVSSGQESSGMRVGPPSPPDPPLRLVGIIWGTAPIAVVEGWPGGETRSLRRGDVVGGIKVEGIGADEVRVIAEGRSWRLRLPSSGREARP